MNIQQPLVSVILPTYNRQALLRRAVQSVLGQTYNNLELIVVDDGSTDRTCDLLTRCTDPRLSYIRRPQRQGPAAARNEGIRRARGELIAFQDSDDEWLIGKLEQQVRLMQESAPELGLVVGSYFLREADNTRVIRADALISGRNYESALAKGYPLATPLWLVRRDLLFQAGLFDQGLPALEDWDLCFKLYRLCRFRAVPDPLLVKYGHADSMSADLPRHCEGLESIHQRYAEFWNLHPTHEARLLRDIGKLHCDLGSRGIGIATLLRAVRRNPLDGTIYWSLASAVAGRSAIRQAAQRAFR